jgi:hypothetical protein
VAAIVIHVVQHCHLTTWMVSSALRSSMAMATSSNATVAYYGSTHYELYSATAGIVEGRSGQAPSAASWLNQVQQVSDDLMLLCTSLTCSRLHGTIDCCRHLPCSMSTHSYECNMLLAVAASISQLCFRSSHAWILTLCDRTDVYEQAAWCSHCSHSMAVAGMLCS